MTSSDWGALLDALRRAAADIKSNAAPPPPVSASSLADTLSAISAHLPSVILTLRAHQGALTGAADVLATLDKAGVSYAGTTRAALLEAPELLAEVDRWLPFVVSIVGGFRAAPRAGPPLTQGEPWKGPQPVDNPSGAVPAGWTPADP